jgi:hypothetical protein
VEILLNLYAWVLQVAINYFFYARGLYIHCHSSQQ